MRPQALRSSIFSEAGTQTSGPSLVLGRRSSLFWLGIYPALFAVVTVVLFRYRGLVEWLKMKITYPRTGYLHGFERHPVARFPLGAAYSKRTGEPVCERPSQRIQKLRLPICNKDITTISCARLSRTVHQQSDFGNQFVTCHALTKP